MGPNTTRGILLVLCLVAVVVPAQTATGARRVASAPLQAGPVLSGSDVIWGERSPSGALLVRRGTPGRRPDVRFRFAAPSSAPSTLSVDGLAASRTHLAVVRTATTTLPLLPSRPVPIGVLGSTGGPVSSVPLASSTTLVAGLLGGPFVKLAGRRGSRRPGGCQPTTVPREPALSGSLLAYVESETVCTRVERSRERIVVQDLAAAGAPRRVIASSSSYGPCCEPRVGVGEVRLAGNYVAWQETRQPRTGIEIKARVADVRTGRLVRTVDRVATGARGDILQWFAVSASGSLAVSFAEPSGPDAGCHRLAVVGRSGRTTVLPQFLPCSFGDSAPSTDAVGFAGGRLLFVSEDRRFPLLLVDARGRGKTLARFTANRAMVGDPAWNGRYAAWASRVRGVTTVWRSGPYAPLR